MEKLSIIGYTGTKFPSWVVEFSFQNLVFLRLEDCKNCISLPQLGQLRSLKHLLVNGLAGVKRVDLEFLGDISVGAKRWICRSLSSVRLSGIENLTSLNDQCMEQLKRTKDLTVQGFHFGSSIWDIPQWVFDKCPQRTSAVAAGEDGELLQWLNGSELEFLELRGCINLKNWQNGSIASSPSETKVPLSHHVLVPSYWLIILFPSRE
ncbi:hypothetical protein GH714_004197 [Hevea brasiliensis]|uniref:R13L1/DRL21-like LRR repeat region domain-containing protein n=1 Tax=Hevea brasiliensis TaxID=3981 RepID=A0A6A6KYS2_HEVBR|nr:hypothetical protein GH714_004197 [Hevea brasiliensis]